MKEKELLQHLKGEKELAVGRQAAALAELAWEKNRPQVTDFYDSQERRVAHSVLGAFSEIGVLSFGGYKKAERARLLIYPRFYLLDTVVSPIRVLQAERISSPSNPALSEVLGSLLETGLKRTHIGDILLWPRGWQVVVAAELADHLLGSWRQVQKIPVRVCEIDSGQLAVEPEGIKIIKTTVASLRLDAVAAEGFGTSRTKMVRQVKGDKVKLNWKTVINPALSVAEGDILALAGRGRVLLYSVGGTTRKGRTNLILHRYF